MINQTNFSDKSIMANMKSDIGRIIEQQEELLKYILEIEKKGNLELNLLLLSMRIFETIDMQDKCI